jgi:sulfane dehydrogenase subunit SoxC
MKKLTRRQFIERGGLAAGATAVIAPTLVEADGPQPRKLGAAIRPYGERSRFEKSLRSVGRQASGVQPAASRTPLQDSVGIITPSSLHFERHHSGVPDIDPAEHRLAIHGLVERPLVLTMDDIRQLPSVSRIHFLECSGNGSGEWKPQPDSDAQRAHGMVSCSEWTGVPLSVVLREVGVPPAAKWLVAEGADAARMTRSVPLTKAMDDALLAYGQNGEALRPEQGYPLRLLLPGWEGNISIKWLSRLKVVETPYFTREETSKYTDFMPDGTARIFTFDMEAKSIITAPSGGQQLHAKGVHQITGLAWSGRGAIRRVDVSVDGGKTWKAAELQAPVLKKAFTRFRLEWQWDGREATLVSRCTDDTGYVQPTRAALIATRGLASNYHNNGIQSWHVNADGTVRNGDV